MAAAKRPRMGRPPAGPEGQLTSEWPITTVRLSSEHRDLLAAVAGALHVPNARVVALALEHYARTGKAPTPEKESLLRHIAGTLLPSAKTR